MCKTEKKLFIIFFKRENRFFLLNNCPQRLYGELKEDFGECTMVVGTQVYRRVRFWSCAALPGVAAFEFSVDDPRTLHCALPYELDLEPTVFTSPVTPTDTSSSSSSSTAGAGGTMEMRGLYTPLPFDFSDPPFPQTEHTTRLSANAPYPMFLIGVSPALVRFFRAADPILSLLARRTDDGLLSEPAAVRRKRAESGDAEKDSVLATQPSTPVLAFKQPPDPAPAPVPMSLSSNPWFPVRFPVPQAVPATATASAPTQAQHQPLPQQCAVTAAPMPQRWYSGVVDFIADPRDPHAVVDARTSPAVHRVSGIDRLAEAASALDADDVAMEVPSVTSPRRSQLTLSQGAAEQQQQQQQQPFIPRPWVITPGLKTPDLDEEVTRVLQQAAAAAAASRHHNASAAMALAAVDVGDPELYEPDLDEEDEEEEDDYAPGRTGEHTHHKTKRFINVSSSAFPLASLSHARGVTAWKGSRSSKGSDLWMGELWTIFHIDCGAHGSPSNPHCFSDVRTHSYTLPSFFRHLTRPTRIHKCLWTGCAREGKPFGNHSGLFRHLRYHTGDKPCKCTIEGCGFSSVDNGELRRHLKLVHHLSDPDSKIQP